MPSENRDALRKVLEALRETAEVVNGKPHKRTPYYISKKRGIQRSEVSRLLTGSGYVAWQTARNVLSAISDEAAEAGLEFPSELFNEYLGHDSPPSGRKIKPRCCATSSMKR